MKEYVPTPQDINELNLAAEKITDEALKSKPLCKIAKSTNFYKTLNGVLSVNLRFFRH